MRACLPAMLLALAAASPADAATRNFGISGFDRVRVDGPFKVRLTTGVPPFAKATGSTTALDGLDFDVVGRTLIIHLNRSSWGGYPGEASGPVEISVGTHELSAAWLNGSGSLRINRVKGLTFDLSLQGSGDATIDQAEVDQLRVTILGSANAALSGRSGKLTATLRGISSLDASGLNAKDATIGAEGPATVKAAVSNSVKIDASGTASITLAGSPACTNKVSGSASVSGCR
ncbi:MAG TPA: head GIN domain-containing protein [Sphingomicrobium sp.]|nr:head GIN domain-containing protein [Sphingomicrobium sp.]